MSKFSPKKIFCFDTETTGLNPWTGDKPFALSACDDCGNTYYAEWDVDPVTRDVTYKSKDIKYIRKFLEDPTYTKIGFNLKFDMRMMEKGPGIYSQGPVEEVYIMARVCNTDEREYSLKHLSQKYLGVSKDDQKELQSEVLRARREAKKRGWDTGGDTKGDYWLPRVINPESVTCRTYAIQDAIRTFGLYLFYSEKMEEEGRTRIYSLEKKVWRIVYEMETRGIAVSPEEIKREKEYHISSSEKALRQLRKYSGNPQFNPRSTLQVSQLLEDKNIQILKKTPSGKIATGSDVLEPYADNKIVSCILTHRSSQKALSSFFSKYEDMLVQDDIDKKGPPVVHPSFNQAGAKTGRFSCSNPPMQQVPGGGGKGGIQARNTFIPRRKYSFLMMDFSQHESRLFAWVANMEELKNAFLEGKDVNNFGTDRVWGGQGNQYALTNAIHSLSLWSPSTNDPYLQDTWERIGWNPKKNSNLDDMLDAANTWLSMHDYSIVKAEKTDLDSERTRTRFKNLLFCKIYGGGPSAAQRLIRGSTYAEAKNYLFQLESAYPGITDCINETSAIAMRQGYIETLYGRKVDVDREFSYKAINYKIQGTGADMMKNSVYNIHKRIRKLEIDAHIIMTIHDEIVVEIADRDLNTDVVKRLKKTMESNTVGIPMKVDCKVSKKSWGEAESVELT